MKVVAKYIRIVGTIANSSQFFVIFSLSTSNVFRIFWLC